MTIEDLDELLDSAIVSFTALDLIYWRSGLEIQRKIIDYIYPARFTYGELQHRTAKVSFLFQLIYQITVGYGEKKRASDRFTVLAHYGSPDWT